MIPQLSWWWVLTCGTVIGTLTLAVWGTGHRFPHRVNSTQTRSKGRVFIRIYRGTISYRLGV